MLFNGCHKGVIRFVYNPVMERNIIQNYGLFPPQPSLLEYRLGAEQFADIPQSPGIYRFFDKNGTLLYVGKAKNLRTRLFTYKRARAGQVSRKVSKLIGQIASFEIEVTGSEKEALLLENRLIRDERPPFNHANKQTEAYYFVYLEPGEDHLEFRLAMRIHDETDPAFWYGCFKGHAPVRHSMGRLLQLLWMAENGTADPHFLPVQLTRRLTPMRCRLPVQKLNQFDLPGLLREYMLGRSYELTDLLAAQIEIGRTLTLFQNCFLEDGLLQLALFYDRKLTPHRKIRGRNRIIPQNQLDDLLIDETQRTWQSLPSETSEQAGAIAPARVRIKGTE
ncbi:MAG: nucleotide excision repair endonuclease [Balneolaceae bacterium]